MRCGKCCGADNVPCEKLTRLDDGRYHCSDYANRLGQQRSANGRHFHCIPMRLLVRHNTAPIGCAYTKKG
ncbi:MAG: hypothetical protein HQ558_06905 [Candidatus Omnitrophica bacterium]|nr:hypothetical protein [Candidatus Omnitrophota bacterium]